MTTKITDEELENAREYLDSGIQRDGDRVIAATVPNLARRLLAALRASRAENERLRANVEAHEAEMKKRAKVFSEVCEERDKAVASEEKNRTCHHFDRTPEGTRIAYFHDGQFILNGDPEPSDDEETGHNCDAMGCSSVEHVIERVILAEVKAAQLAQKMVSEYITTPASIGDRVIERNRERLVDLEIDLLNWAEGKNKP